MPSGFWEPAIALAKTLQPARSLTQWVRSVELHEHQSVQQLAEVKQ